jgi:hypothetical protein
MKGKDDICRVQKAIYLGKERESCGALKWEPIARLKRKKP